ncbi:MAG: putative sulfate exporter family transporter [Bdellovibrionales bacterium]|nr:putative sulfate exporter family transporter [Bdellovibrionales bacterium]
MLARILFPLAGLLCLAPFISSGTALFMGVALALIFGNPYLDLARKYTHRLLAISVVGMGFGMDLAVIGRVGLQGIGYTIAGISLTLTLGYFIGKLLKTDRNVSILVSVGTAICGGSAIAAVAPVIRAKSHEVSVALGTVFVLNAVALFLFPPLGHYFGLTQHQFGLWSALAIHDTSSVVGASLQYGAEALQVGTTVKLARALWIVPIAFAIGWVVARNQQTGAAGKGKKPWFILGFILAAALVTWVPVLQPAGHVIESIAKRLLVLTLFLIGSGLTRETLRSVGARPFFQGVLLWIIAASATFGAIEAGWIH